MFLKSYFMKQGQLDNLIRQYSVLRDFTCEGCDGMNSSVVCNQSLVKAVVNFIGNVVLDIPRLKILVRGSRLEFHGCYK